MNLPDTIIFKYDQPYIWYFAKDKVLKRKSKMKLTINEIERVFLKKIPKSGIVAMYVTQFPVNEQKEKLIYEYFDKTELSIMIFL